MIDYEDHHPSDYKGRDVKAAAEEAQEMVDTIMTRPEETPLESARISPERRYATSVTTSTKVSWNTASR